MNRQRTWRHWTMDDLRMLRELWNMGLSASQIGQRIGRTTFSVEQQIRKLRDSGAVFPGRLKPNWTPGQERVVTDAVDALIAQLSVRLNRSRRAVAQRIARAVIVKGKRERARDLHVA